MFKKEVAIFIKKYPTEIMGIYFSIVFCSLALVSLFIQPIDNIVTIPLPLAISVFTLLLSGLISIYLYANYSEIKGWRKFAELFIMLAAICASLSDGFWIFLTVAAIIIIAGNIYEKTLALDNTIIYGWLGMLGISIISSFFAVESRVISFWATFGLVLYTSFFIAVYNQNFIQERGTEFVQRIGILLSFSIVSTVIFSLWHYNMSYYIDVLIFRFQASTGTDSLGMASIYGEWPTHSSAFLSLAFWVLIGIRSTYNLSKTRKIIINSGIIFSFIGTLATLSRNAFLFLGISIGMSLLILIIQKKQKRWFFLLLGIGSVFLGILYYLVTHFQKWRELFTNPLQQFTIASRIDQYQFGIEQIQQNDNFLIGIGLMNFGPLYQRMMDDINLSVYLHQLFLSINLEIGYIVIIIFLFLLYLIGRQIILNNRANNHNMIFLVVFFSWLATGIFDNWLYFIWSSTLFMILIALGSNNNNKSIKFN